MPTERMEEVEVVCEVCGGAGSDGAERCPWCHGAGFWHRLAHKGSLTEARLRLADATEAERLAYEVWTQSGSPRIGDLLADWQDKRIEYEESLAALRSARGASTKRAGG